MLRANETSAVASPNRGTAQPHAMVLRSRETGLEPEAFRRRALRPREVRVAVEAVGVNPVDWKMRDNLGLHLVHRLLGPPGPFVCGMEFAGVVSEVGRAARGVSVGDAVVGGIDFARRQRGSYATEVVVDDTQLAVLPPRVDVHSAACLPVAGGIARMALAVDVGRRGLNGGKVLVLGASGGVGHLALQLARNRGAQVFGVCSARNAPRVARLGATPIPYDDRDAFEEALSHGPFDLVVNAVDTVAYPVRRVAGLLRGNGRQVLVAPTVRDLPCLALPRVTTRFVRPTRQTLEPLVRELAEGRLEVAISERLPLEQAESALQRSREGRVVGKVVLTVGDA